MARHTYATWEAADDAFAMLIAAENAGVAHVALTHAAIACARVALVHVPAAEDRPRRALEAAATWIDRSWFHRKATWVGLRARANAAAQSAVGGTTAAANHAAYAADAAALVAIEDEHARKVAHLAADAAAYAAYAIITDPALGAAHELRNKIHKVVRVDCGFDTNGY